MMATLTSFGSLPSFLAFSPTNEQEASPYWSEWMVGRNTNCRFLSLNTAEEMQTFIQRNFLAASTLAAIGTHCALEYTPIRMNVCISSAVFKDKNLQFVFRPTIHSDQYGDAS